MSSPQKSSEDKIRVVVRPILHDTYGRYPRTDALADQIVGQIAAGADENRIRMTCWDWMTGGTTAEAVARDIFVALGGVER